MKLRVLLPSGVLLDEEVVKVVAEAENGCFCLLPRHIDFVAALVPGLFGYETAGGREEFLALDAGTLVKQGAAVMVAARRAIRAEGRGELRRAVREKLAAQDDEEKKARAASASLENEILRRFLELGREA